MLPPLMFFAIASKILWAFVPRIAKVIDQMKICSLLRRESKFGLEDGHINDGSHPSRSKNGEPSSAIVTNPYINIYFLPFMFDNQRLLDIASHYFPVINRCWLSHAIAMDILNPWCVTWARETVRTCRDRHRTPYDEGQVDLGAGGVLSCVVNLVGMCLLVVGWYNSSFWGWVSWIANDKTDRISPRTIGMQELNVCAWRLPRVPSRTPLGMRKTMTGHHLVVSQLKWDHVWWNMFDMFGCLGVASFADMPI